MKRMEGSAKEAGKSFAAFKKDNPDADPVTTQQAVDASILQANMPILDVATKDAKKDDKFNVDELNAAAGSGDSLSDPLRNAARPYANKGQLGSPDIAGQDIKQKHNWWADISTVSSEAGVTAPPQGTLQPDPNASDDLTGPPVPVCQVGLCAFGRRRGRALFDVDPFSWVFAVFMVCDGVALTFWMCSPGAHRTWRDRGPHLFL